MWNSRKLESKPVHSGSFPDFHITPFRIWLSAGIAAIAAVGWYFGIHAPEQRRVEQAQIEQEREESEARRFEAARFAAVALDKSPLTLWDLRLGNYSVRLRMAGYEDWYGELELEENVFLEINVTLVRSTRTVTLASEPAGLDYAIRGEVTRTGRTPAELSLPTGRYEVAYRREGWTEQLRVVDLKRNERVEQAVEFFPGSL
jgi:hypothetical protein